MASIGWIDFSTKDRNKVGSILDMLKPEGMVDELGLGTLRDGIANQMFPGISTIQTRAKYFFIILYILLDFQRDRNLHKKGKLSTKFLEDKEYEIMWDLASKYNYQEGQGVIGISKKKPNKIVRRPSAIYWNGLNTYDFINAKGLSADTFLKQANKQTLETLLSTIQTGDDTQGDDFDAEYENMFQVKVPPSINWQVDLTLNLTKQEAEFFKDRIISVAKGKLISELLKREDLWEIFDQSENFMQFSKAAINLELPDNLKHNFVLAHDFSQLMYGAHIAYNCQIQSITFSNTFHEHAWEEWLSKLKLDMINYEGFDIDLLFSYAPTTRDTTKKFAINWWEESQNGFKQIQQRTKLIENQEAIVKGPKARLRWEKFEDVKAKEWVGLKHFEFRFFQARTILRDIRNGLKT